MATDEKLVKIRRIIAIVGLVIIVALAVLSWFLFDKYQQALRSNPQTETSALMQRIGQVIALPPEQPTIATVLDRQKLSNKALADKAQNNDKLIIFPQAKRIILYRPDTQRVVDMLIVQDAAIGQ